MTSSLVDMRCIEVIRSLYKDRANDKRVEDARVSLDPLLTRIADFRDQLLKDYGDILDERVPIQHFTKLKIDLYTSRMYAIVLQHYLYHARVELPGKQNYDPPFCFQYLHQVPSSVVAHICRSRR